jgi:hypothetical protein
VLKQRLRRPAMLIKVVRGIPQTVQANAGIVPQIRLRPLPTKSFPFIIIHLPPYHRRYIVQLLKKRRKIDYQRNNQPTDRPTDKPTNWHKMSIRRGHLHIVNHNYSSMFFSKSFAFLTCFIFQLFLTLTIQ